MVTNSIPLQKKANMLNQNNLIVVQKIISELVISGFHASCLAGGLNTTGTKLPVSPILEEQNSTPPEPFGRIEKGRSVPKR